MLLRLISDACDGARAVDIPFQDKLASIDNPVIAPSKSTTQVRSTSKPTAAPPAMVPNRQLLISITFLTV